MKNQNQAKLFAFKLAKKTQEAKPEQQWKTRDGVSTAGCTFPAERYSSTRGKDAGMYC